jgi:hypothetical protein
VSLDANAATGTVDVGAAAADCAWTAVSHDAWITVTDGASGSGNGAVSYSVAPNPANATRTGTLTIAGQTFTVTQTGVPCSYAVSPPSVSLDANAATGTVSVDSAAADCSWTAVSHDSWITVTAGSAGTGDGTVSYSVAANETSSPRTGSMTVAGEAVTIVQAGITVVPPPPPVPEGGEGCSPGYWKGRKHFDSYPSPYRPQTLFSAAFGVGPNITLLEALRSKGGGEEALRRHAAAGLLNAVSEEVSYLYSVSGVVDMVQHAYATGSFNPVKNLLEQQNEAGCPLSRSAEDDEKAQRKDEDDDSASDEDNKEQKEDEHPARGKDKGRSARPRPEVT